jgi:glycosyltransferase involved in cell wall biosynthesis
LKLLYITNGITGAGGLERVLSIKASFLAEHYNYEVHILSLNESGKKTFYEFSSKVLLHSIEVGGNPLKYVKEYVKGIRQIISVIKPDVISVCDDGLKGFFLPILLRKPCPMIYERHVSRLIALNEANRNGFQRIFIETQFKLMNVLGKTFDAFIVLTEGNKAEWKLLNLKVIANPTSFYPSECAVLLNKKIIAVGRQGYQKGYDRLLQAWQMVNQKHSDWKLEIYGKIEPKQKLNEQAICLGISDALSFYPPEKDIQSKYLDASIYVMSSRYEGFGMVLIEAMACGVPCVSFDCPHGPSDIISHEEDGLLVPDGNSVALAKALCRLVEENPLRKKMGIKAKENVQRFLPEVIVKQWDELFNELTK